MLIISVNYQQIIQRISTAAGHRPGYSTKADSIKNDFEGLILKRTMLHEFAGTNDERLNT